MLCKLSLPLVHNVPAGRNALGGIAKKSSQNLYAGLDIWKEGQRRGGMTSNSARVRPPGWPSAGVSWATLIRKIYRAVDSLSR